MPNPWKVCPSLETLHGQLNRLAPTRDRSSDGSIGDAAHSNRSSDHNPHLFLKGQYWVSARDWTHSPKQLDCNKLAASLLQSRDHRIKYVIWNRKIMSGNGGPSPWVWRSYVGSNPHTRHLHLSVVSTIRSLDPTPWALPVLGVAPPGGLLRLGSSGEEVRIIQSVLNRWYPSLPPLVEDGEFGIKTEERVKYFQLRADLDADGVVGPATRLYLGIK